jgi:hypothetical protein
MRAQRPQTIGNFQCSVTDIVLNIPMEYETETTKMHRALPVLDISMLLAIYIALVNLIQTCWLIPSSSYM